MNEEPIVTVKLFISKKGELKVDQTWRKEFWLDNDNDNLVSVPPVIMDIAVCSMNALADAWKKTAIQANVLEANK